MRNQSCSVRQAACVPAKVCLYRSARRAYSISVTPLAVGRESDQRFTKRVRSIDLVAIFLKPRPNRRKADQSVTSILQSKIWAVLAALPRPICEAIRLGAQRLE